MQKHYVLIDCDRVQDYVFASSRLREICNASSLLDQLEVETLPGMVTDLCVNTIRSGGGVVLEKFDTPQQAKDFIRSAHDLYRTYGISVTSYTRPFPHSIVNFYDEVLLPLHKSVRSQKDSPEGRAFHISTLLAVPCESSGIDPAQRPVEIPDGLRRMSHSEVEKRAHWSDTIVESDLSQRLCLRLPHDFGGVVGWTIREALREKDLPGTSEKRLLGIVYADVNGLGKQIPPIAKDENTYALFAKELRNTVRDSLREALDQVLSPAVNQRLSSSKLRLSTTALPVRVLYVGGDDLAVAIQGCYALDFVERLLHLFEQKSVALLKPLADVPCLPSHLTMSAGIVLAPYNYPIQNFNRVGHELEERAKCFGRYASSPSSSLVDFCLIKNNVAGSLQQGRRGQQINNFLLYGGPYTLQELNRLKQASVKLKEESFPRNKLKQLREILSHKELTAKFLYAEWWHGLNDYCRKVFFETVCIPFNLDGPPLLPRQDKGYWVTPVIDVVELSDLL